MFKTLSGQSASANLFAQLQPNLLSYVQVYSFIHKTSGMNSPLLLLMALLSMTTVTQGFICASVCRKVTCVPLRCRPPNIIERRGLFCGCCDVCVRLLKEGEFCPPTAINVRCGYGLFCNGISGRCKALFNPG
ncbi:hypothetical protein BsWGS_25388 [Bradybaena similaris]